MEITPTNHSKKDLEKRLSQLKKEVPRRGFERHPLRLENVSDLDAELKSDLVTALAAREPIQTIIAFPPQLQRGSHYVPKQALLFTPTEVIHLQASLWPDQEPQVTSLKGSGLMFMTVTLILLYGFLEIVAQGPISPARLTVEFNTVAWYKLSQPLQHLLLTARATPSALTGPVTYSPATQQAFETLPLKFSNGLQIYGLLPGEALEDLVFQPGDWKRWLFMFRQPISANTLLMLTSNFVVVIREEAQVSWGWIITYIPRDSIVEILSQPHGKRHELAFHMKRGDQIGVYKVSLNDEETQAWRLRWVQHGGQWQDLPGAG